MDDPRGFHLPQRRLARVVLAGRAGGVDAAVKHREIAGAALGARRGKTRLIGRVESERVDEAVAIIVREIHDLAVGDLAIGLGEAHIAFRVQAFRGLVVDDAVGLEPRALVVDLHIAHRGDAVIGVVVIDLVRLHEHLCLPLRRHRGPFGRRQLREFDLLLGRRRRDRPSPRHEGEDGGQGGKAAAEDNRGRTRARGRRHHPSS